MLVTISVGSAGQQEQERGGCGKGDIDAVLDGEKRDVRLLDGRGRVGFAKLSASGRALNFTIASVYYTVPLRSVLAVLDGFR